MTVRTILRVLLIACSVCPPLSLQSREQPVYCSPASLAVDPTGRALYAADETGRRVSKVDLIEQRVVRRFALPAPPTGLALDSRARRLYVTSRSPSGEVFVIDLHDGRVLSTLVAGHTTMAPVLAPGGARLYVCNRFENSLSVLDLAAGTSVAEIALVREPVAASLTADGRTLVVANHRSADAADGFDVASAVSLVDVVGGAVTQVRLPGGSVNCRGICLSPDDRYAFVSHILARNHLPATQLDAGWLTTNAVSVIDLAKRRLLGAVILDDLGRGAANPWDLECTPDGRWLCVAVAGVHELVVIELPEMLRRMRGKSYGVRGSGGEQSVDLWYEESTYAQLGFLRDIRKRVELGGRGPRDLVVVGDRVLVGMYFSGNVESIDLDDLDALPESIELEPQPALSLERRGEILFNDATICYQGWQSCASCHPDGRADGLNWDLTNDGIGNFKNAKSLVFAHRTAPSTMTGVFESFEECVRHEITTILFAGPQEENARAIVGYLRSLKPVPSPHLERAPGSGAYRLSDAARRGRKVFDEAGCSECHVGEHFTIRKTRNVGTYVPGDYRKSFDVPSLREAWRTAPYLHDGRARTIEEVFTKFNSDGKHGDLSGLSPEEIADLARYVLSL